MVAPHWTPASHDVALSGGLASLKDQRAKLAVALHEALAVGQMFAPSAQFV